MVGLQINVAEPITLFLLTIATVLLIFLGREVQRSLAPAVALTIFLGLAIAHTVQLSSLTAEAYDLYSGNLMACLAVDCAMIFVTFFAYLWIDDIECKKYNKKSYDNSLDWLWKKV